MITQLKLLLFIVIVSGFGYLYYTNKELTRELNTAIINNKAYALELDSSAQSNREFQLTIRDLGFKKDSISERLTQIVKDNEFKSNKIKELSYLLSSTSRTDSIVLTDTIFRDPEFKLDTLVGDRWFYTKLHLEYPGNIKFTPVVISEFTLVTSSKRETIEPPKRFFLARWFQKKHTVLNIDVVSSNPYEIKRTQRFIKILK